MNGYKAHRRPVHVTFWMDTEAKRGLLEQKSAVAGAPKWAPDHNKSEKGISTSYDITDSLNSALS